MIQKVTKEIFPKRHTPLEEGNNSDIKYPEHIWTIIIRHAGKDHLCNSYNINVGATGLNWLLSISLFNAE